MGDSIESPEFLLCGFQWQLRIFPGGSLESHRGYISYYLASKSNRVARASYKLSVCNQIAGADDESFASSGVRVFEAKGVQVRKLIFRELISRVRKKQLLVILKLLIIRYGAFLGRWVGKRQIYACNDAK